VVTFIWAFFAAGVITLLPLWEGRHTLALFAKFMVGKAPTKTTIEALDSHGHGHRMSLAEEHAMQKSMESSEKTSEV
jgi:hypothetical protein